jgi:type I restriction enzyme, S subunit
MSHRTRCVPIGELVDPVSTWNPTRDAPDTEIQYIDIGSIDQDSKTIIRKAPIPTSEAPSRARQLVQAGDILVSTVRPNLNSVARVSDDYDGATASTGFCVLRPVPGKLHDGYLFNWVKSPTFVSRMTKLATGQNYPAISDRIVMQCQIPLPPLAEQKRIAAILDAADVLRAKRRSALAKLDQLGQAIFVEMFGRTTQIEKAKLNEVCDLITDGTHYTPTYTQNGVKFLSAKNVTSGRINWSDIKFIPESLHLELQKRVSPRVGDVLLAKNGTTGVAAIVDRDEIFDIYVSLALLRAGPEIRPHYLLHGINSPDLRKQFKGALKGIGVSNLHLVDIRSATIPLPSLADQDEFIERTKLVDAQRTLMELSAQKLRAAHLSLQHRAFQGEL